MFDSFLRGDHGIAPTDLRAVALGLLLAFLSGQALAWIYMATHRGLSYSRAFVVSLVLLSVIAALVMAVLANNLVTAFGLMAVFAIVRFRNMLRDTLDTAYVLATIALGMACGLQKFTTAALGAATIAAVLAYVRLVDWGTRHRHDLILHLRWTRRSDGLAELHRVLDRHSRATFCANRRTLPGTGNTELSFRLLLRDPARADELLAELAAVPGVDGVGGTAAADESEV